MGRRTGGVLVSVRVIALLLRWAAASVELAGRTATDTLAGALDRGADRCDPPDGYVLWSPDTHASPRRRDGVSC
ncbi:MAG: hypothetical protein ACRD0V_07185 [Acidimicrobiales bacterium]